MPRMTGCGAAVAVLALVGGACSDAGPSNMAQVSFNLATQPAPAAVKGVAFADVGTPETFTDGSNTLVIGQVELVLREIELHRAGITTECADGVSDDCEELELGPILLDLPLGTAGAARNFSVELAAGSYDKVELELHKTSSSDDAGFIAAHPEIADASVRVTGTYNGVDFVYTGRFDSEQEFDLNPPLVASETGATDLTLMVDLDKWFRNSSGTLIDPATANAGQPNQGIVEENIKSALDAFEDENHDGLDDGPNHQ
jgi:hypothetical protein